MKFIPKLPGNRPSPVGQPAPADERKGFSQFVHKRLPAIAGLTLTHGVELLVLSVLMNVPAALSIVAASLAIEASGKYMGKHAAKLVCYVREHTHLRLIRKLVSHRTRHPLILALGAVALGASITITSVGLGLSGIAALAIGGPFLALGYGYHRIHLAEEAKRKCPPSTGPHRSGPPNRDDVVAGELGSEAPTWNLDGKKVLRVATGEITLARSNLSHSRPANIPENASRTERVAASRYRRSSLARRVMREFPKRGERDLHL